jgi:hypothetical protein
VDLAQLFRFIVVELIHAGSNPRFDMGVVFMANYSFSGGDVLIDSDALLVIDFVNLKIKLTQSFECAHMGRMYVRMFIEMSAHKYMNILYCV